VILTRSMSGSGFATRVTSMLEAYIVAGHEVDVVHFQFGDERPLPAGITNCLGEYTSVALAEARLRQHASTFPPLVWHCNRSIPDVVRGRMYDLVQAETSATWGVAAQMSAGARLLTLLDDDAERLHRLGKTSASRVHRVMFEVSARKYARWQRRAMAGADQIWFVSQVELARLAGEPLAANARLVPNGADDALWDIPIHLESDAPELLFVGPSRYQPNLHGLKWFLSEVWPRVIAAVPSARLRVVGEGWEELDRTPGVDFIGWRGSLLAEYARSRLVIAPLFAGGGTKLKVVEAMAAGRPVVATPVAAEGFVESAGLIISDDPDRFAAAVSRCLNDIDGSNRIGQTNRHAIGHLKWSAVWDRALADLERLVR
jgi:glycosyltransferase involved in cell wall biosynthesis